MTNNIFIKNLEKIGTKLSDFEEVPNPKKNLSYFILGKGNFGYAEKMKSKINNVYYAIKKLDTSKINIKNFQRETEIMFNLNHEYIVKFYGYFEDKENISKFKEIYKDKKDIENENEDKNIYCLILEYVPNGSLNDYIQKYKEYLKSKNLKAPIKEDFIIKIFKQLLIALIYLSNKSVLHRDLKPDNILFDKNYNIKISDFGLSALYQDENPQNKNKPTYLFGQYSMVGRYDFISPEIEKKQKYDFESDIFSLGLTMLCLMSYENPIKMYNDQTTKKVFRVINYDYINPSYNKYLINLVLLMLKEDPNLRPTAKQAYDDLIEIEKMNKKQTPNNQVYKNFENIPEAQKFQRKLTYQDLNPLLNIQNDIQYQKCQNSPINYSVTNNQNNLIYQNLNNKDNNIICFNQKFQSAEVKPTNYKINPNIIKTGNKEFKNTSLIRTIQCLCRCVKENIKSQLQNNINNSISIDIINIMEITALKMANKIDKEKFFQSIKDFSKKLESKIDVYKSDKDISPKVILSYIFKIINDDFKINKINWKNDLLNGLIEPPKLPKNVFPHIYEKVETFKKEYNNPFVDKFYYISLELIQCQKCNYLLQVYPHTSYFILLQATTKDKISNLVNNYIKSSKNVEIKCNKCFNNGVKINAFFTTPKYLMIFFDGEPKKEKILDEIIDISSNCFTNIGYKKYSLYGFITKDNNDNEYKSIFKNEHDNNWFLYYSIDSIKKFGFNFQHYYFPTIAIYKGFN